VDPDKVSRGVGWLKEEDIDVTTGIILGLPGDTPGGFSGTLEWLKRTRAYSVVHPFVLSVLPGTDFRAQATDLGLQYDPRPPYYVRSTQTFPEAEFRPALLRCEQMFDMELDYIPPPSLVDTGPGLLTALDGAEYVSKWIVYPEHAEWERALAGVIQKATDPLLSGSEAVTMSRQCSRCFRSSVTPIRTLSSMWCLISETSRQFRSLTERLKELLTPVFF
jgi:hypothetical protein